MSGKKIKELSKLLNWAQNFFGDREISSLIDELQSILKEKSKNFDFSEENLSSLGKSIEDLPPEIININKGLALFTDGACRGNPGPGSWAVLGMIIKSGKLQTCFESSGIDVPTTNNRMELSAVINALRLSKDHLIDGENDLNIPLYLFSDSKYVLEGIEKWMPGWKKKGWRKADNKTPENVDLWKEVDLLCEEFRSLKFIWVKGHAGHPQNEFADKLCNKTLDEAGF